MKTKLELLREFYNGKWYALFVTLLAFLSHLTGYDIACFLIMTATLVVGCFIAYDFRFAMMPFLCTVCFVTVEHTPNHPSFSDYYAQPLQLTTLIIAFSLILIGFVVFVIRNRRRANSFSWKGSFLGLGILCAALCLNGIFNAAYSLQNLAYAISFPLTLLITFVLYALFVHFEDGAFDHFMYCLVMAGMLIVAQLLLAYVTGVVRFDENGTIIKETVVLGWAVWNSFGGLLTMLIPSCFYFAATHRHGWIFYGLGLLEFFAAVLSQSRTATLVGAAILLICLVTVCFFGRNRKLNRWITLGLVVIGVLGVVILWDKIVGVLQNFINYGFDDNGRFERFEAGIKKFLEHPVFGAGFYDSGILDTSWEIRVYPYLYHNTIIQMMGSAGIVGLLAYLWHRFCTVRLVLRKPNLYKSFLAMGILALLAFGMLDVLFFITYPLFYYSMMLLFREKSGEEIQ